MEGKIVTRQIRELVWKPLASVGFDRRTSRTAWRERGEHVEVVNFQSFNAYLAAGLGSTSFSFGVNLGIWPRYVPPLHDVKQKDGRVLPPEYACPLRRQLQNRLEQAELPRKDVWFVEPDGANLMEVVADAAAVVHDEGLAWFDALSTPEAIAALLEGPEEMTGGTWGFGREGSPLRIYLVACTQMRLGTFKGDELAWLQEYTAYRRATKEFSRTSKGDKPAPPPLPT